jgi:hypothetical protein
MVEKIITFIYSKFKIHSIVNEIALDGWDENDFPQISGEKRAILSLLVKSNQDLFHLLRDSHFLTMGGQQDLEESAISSLISDGIIQKEENADQLSSLLYFVNDIVLCRKPCLKALEYAKKKVPPEIYQSYYNEMKGFLENYTVNQQENTELFLISLNAEVQKFMTFLSSRPVSQTDFNKIPFSNRDKILQGLWKAKNLIYLTDDSGMIWYAQISELHFELTFHQALLTTAFNLFENHKQNPENFTKYVSIISNFLQKDVKKNKEVIKTLKKWQLLLEKGKDLQLKDPISKDQIYKDILSGGFKFFKLNPSKSIILDDNHQSAIISDAIKKKLNP